MFKDTLTSTEINILEMFKVPKFLVSKYIKNRLNSDI